MKSAGVRQLKTRLSKYLQLVRSGETAIVTDSDEVVAELQPGRPRTAAAASLDQILKALSQRGDITCAAVRKGRWTWKVKDLGPPPGTAAELLDEIRSDR